MKNKRVTISMDKLKQTFDYDPDNGGLIYKNSRQGLGSKRAGTKAGTIYPNGYLMVMVNRQRYYVHRLVWFWHHGYFPERPMLIDHINQNKIDNRIENLRVVNHHENLWNCKVNKNNTSGYRGVCPSQYEDIPWMAYIRHDNEQHHIGFFETAEDAARAYNKKAIELRGEFAQLNVLPEQLPDWMK